MKAIGFFVSDPQTGAESLRDIDIPKPSPEGRDLLVKIEAVSINPVDVKTRSRVPPDRKEATILGFDGAGVVERVGDQVRNFKPGDEVFYAGTLVRPGTYAEYHLVDERIVGPKPKSLGFPEAAAVPLTAITSWEMLFHRLAIPEDSSGASVLIVGGTGGVGSMAVQLARQLTKLTVVTTSFDDAQEREWCRKNGADHVLDHTKPIAAQVAALNIAPIKYVFSTNMTGIISRRSPSSSRRRGASASSTIRSRSTCGSSRSSASRRTGRICSRARSFRPTTWKLSTIY